jgi:hypothetical protein
MAEISCTLEEFHNMIGPRVRNDVATVTKQKKNQLGLVCQHCNNKVSELDAAHKHESSRKNIIESILEDYKTNDGKYIIPHIQKVLDKIKEYHKSKDVFFFLCKECHRKYDNSNNNHTQNNENFKNYAQNAYDLKQTILTVFKENPEGQYSPRMIFDIIQQRNTKYYADTLWGLWKQEFLIHPQHGYYQWNDRIK